MLIVLSGSSPRTWGTWQKYSSRHQVKRFIPTHVGNIRGGVWDIPAKSVHPHARGEHRKKAMSHMQIAGSSPRTWGTSLPKTWINFSAGFIPTHVGNMKESRPDPKRKSVHPHARGEHQKILDEDIFILGSSPRTWGTFSNIRGGRIPTRFIPTHVGNILLRCPKDDAKPVHPHARGEHVKSDRQRR